jgi:hypothetical protein
MSAAQRLPDAAYFTQLYERLAVCLYLGSGDGRDRLQWVSSSGQALLDSHAQETPTAMGVTS